VNGQQQRGRLGSEQAAYLALGLLAWLVEQHTEVPVKAYMATNAEDLGKGTDVGLVLPRRRGRERRHPLRRGCPLRGQYYCRV